MSVNTGKRVKNLLLLLLVSTFFCGCFSKGRTPYVSFISAGSRLTGDGISHRVDVVVDLRNQRYETYRDISLTISFANAMEASFTWDEMKPYGYLGGEESMEVVDGVSKSAMLGGSFETLVDEIDGAFYVYSTEVSSALLTYKDASGAVYKKDVSRDVAQTIQKSFGKLSSDDSERADDRRERLNRLKKKVSVKKK